MITIILMIFLIEGGLQIIYSFVQHPASKNDVVESPEGEGEADTMSFEPVVGWRGKERHGKYVNTNSEGLRVTWNPQYPEGEKVKTIYVFGGSTTWGMGARDHYTIPSYLSKQLHEKGYRFVVHNYGEHGYIFLQEVMRLILLLRKGERPDYVIFYDGFNNVWNAYKEGSHGLKALAAALKREFAQREKTNMQYIWIGMKGLLGTLKENSMIYRAITNISLFLSPPPPLIIKEEAKYDNDKTLKELAKKTVESYMRTFNLLDSLSKAYGFQYFCFWQPVIYLEERLTEEEKKLLETDLTMISGNPIVPFYLHINQLLAAESLPHFFNLQGALRNRKRAYYTDSCHLTERGNEVIATKMIEVVEPALKANE